jgi:hypothetical protein
MHRMQSVDGLQFDHHAILDDKIEPVEIQPLSSERHRVRLLPFERKARGFQLQADCLVIDRLDGIEDRAPCAQ